MNPQKSQSRKQRVKLISKILFLTILVLPLMGPNKAQNKKFSLQNIWDEKIEVSSSFGEYRSDHFHLGLDFRVKGRVGLPLRLPKAGYIDSLGNDPNGYGLYLTIQHQDNTYSRFAHLQDIIPYIWQMPDYSEYKQKWQDNQKFYFQKKNLAKLFKAGQTIAYSGESGVGPPHVHYEYRDQQNRAVNPMSPRIKALTIKDNQPPVFSRLFIQPMGGISSVNEKYSKQEFHVARIGRNRFRVNQAIQARAQVRFFVAGFDNANTDNVLGFYKLTMYLNGKQVYHVTFDKIDPRWAHRMGLVYDVEETSFHGIVYVYRLFAEAPAALSWQKGRPYIDLLRYPKGKNNVQIKATDAAGNTSTLYFSFFNDLRAKDKTFSLPDKSNVKPDTPATIAGKAPNLTAVYPVGAVLSKSHVQWKTYGTRSSIPPQMEQLGKAFDLRPRGQYLEKDIQIRLPIPSELKGLRDDQAGIYRLHERDNRITLVRSLSQEDIDQDFIEFSSRQQGLFVFLRDNARPQWIGSHFNPGAYYTPEKFIPGVYVKDKGSGIDPKSIQAFLSGRKIKANYNPNRNWIFFDFDESDRNYGAYQLKLSVKDKAGNKSSIFQADFYLRKDDGSDQIIASSSDKSQRSRFQADLDINKEQILASIDGIFSVHFPAGSIRSKAMARRIYIQRLSVNKIPAKIRWNLKGDYVYIVYIPPRSLTKGYHVQYKYTGAGPKTGLVLLTRQVVHYTPQQYNQGTQSFISQKMNKRATFGIYYDSSSPEWGNTLFQEKRIYEKHNITIGSYIFDQGFGVDPQTIQVFIDGQKFPFKYDKKKKKIVVLAKPKDLKKGFRRLIIRAKDFAGNPTTTLDKYFIIRYKPKWGH